MKAFFSEVYVNVAMQLSTLYMAPMKGFTDCLFRSVFADHFGGFDLAVAPFISSKRDHRIKPAYVKDVLPEHNTRLPVIPQILSNAARDFTALADYLYDLGYPTVNWNLGCPYPTVANKKRGAGMLAHPEMIQRFLEEALTKLKATLSIKIRLGWQSTADIFRLVPILNQVPLEEVIVHPRTGIQRYEGTVDLDAFARLSEMIDHPVVYSGDINSRTDFNELTRRFPYVNRWMIGRGCLANPFLPHMIKDEGRKIEGKIERMQRFHQALFEAYSNTLDGPGHVLNKMKGIWKYFAMPLANCEKSLKAIRKSKRPNQYLDAVNRFFETEARWRQTQPVSL